MKVRAIGNGTNFVENGVEFQINAKTPKQSKAAFAYSCSLCNKNDKCAHERCAIKIAHDVAQQRLGEKSVLFFEKGLTKQGKAYTVGFATKNFAFTCEKCKEGGWDTFQSSCSECPVCKAFQKNVEALNKFKI